MRLARYTLPALLQGMGWLAVRFLRSYRGHGPARYTLPSLLQGHPPSQSSGTLMSLQEGIAEPCAQRLAMSLFIASLWVDALTSHTDPPRYPDTYMPLLASCLRYLTRVFPFPVPAQSSQAESPAVRTL